VIQSLLRNDSLLYNPGEIQSRSTTPPSAIRGYRGSTEIDACAREGARLLSREVVKAVPRASMESGGYQPDTVQ
jgi:hypothetical protein